MSEGAWIQRGHKANGARNTEYRVCTREYGQNLHGTKIVQAGRSTSSLSDMQIGRQASPPGPMHSFRVLSASPTRPRSFPLVSFNAPHHSICLMLQPSLIPSPQSRRLGRLSTKADFWPHNKTVGHHEQTLFHHNIISTSSHPVRGIFFILFEQSATFAHNNITVVASIYTVLQVFLWHYYLYKKSLVVWET